MPFLQTEQVTYSYPASEGQLSLPVLQDVTLEINQGETVALLGHNGCGKSTLSKLWNGMVLPTGGKVWVDGMDTAEESTTFAVRSCVGLVMQNPDNQLVASVVEEDVAFGPENLGVPPKEIRRRVDSALKAVGLYDQRLSAPHKLSGGQKQRVAIAGILAMEPRCIVLDEPTSMLDPKGRQEVLDTVWRLNREKNITVVLITHYMEEAAMADRVVVMDEGKVLLDGTPSNVFSQVELLRSRHLDVPPVTALCHALRKEGVPLPEGILTAEECVSYLQPLLMKKEGQR
jgi:energy-coupling factor transport system ATP-binding protein